MIDESTLTDAQLRQRHGDHPRWSIKLWRSETKAGVTTLDYIDWRADKKFWSRPR